MNFAGLCTAAKDKHHHYNGTVQQCKKAARRVDTEVNHAYLTLDPLAYEGGCGGPLCGGYHWPLFSSGGGLAGPP